MAELMSPPRPPRPTITVKTPEGWKRPDEVMRVHKLRMKQKALQARMSRTQVDVTTKSSVNVSADSVGTVSEKRKNPFRSTASASDHNNLKKLKERDEEIYSQDSSLFRLLRLDSSGHAESDKCRGQTSFKNILSRSSSFTFGNSTPTTTNTSSLNRSRTSFNNSLIEKELVLKTKGSKVIPVDWKLRTKVRFMSLKPFAWNQTLKTCEEASGITGFVRCLDTTSNSENCSLDTSANARFHQCCLVWQHPVLPWVELYPRHVVQAHNDSSPTFAAQQSIRDSLHRAWSESFRSIFQLVRAQQCPYFYVLANSFTCLFRAAGICGHSVTHAIITPTTRGFRQILRDEDIVFTMPLKEGEARRRSFENQADTGYNSLDVTADAAEDGKEMDKKDDDLEEEDAEEWLQSMGVEEAEIKRIKSSQSAIEFGEEKKLDKTPESLVYIEGIEAQALFNFLLNCKSNTATTGPLAGIPPTLLAPVAFHGATLRPLKVRESVVRMGDQQYHSVELRGPVLPHTVHSLCHMLMQSLDEFSLTFASIESTSAFSLLHGKVLDPPETEKDDPENADKTKTSDSVSLSPKSKKSSCAFGRENLSDCGLRPSILKDFCKSDAEAVESFDSLKYSEKMFAWS